MEINRGIRNSLQFSFIYDAVQKLIGATNHRKSVVERLNITKGSKVVEVGCGPGKILDTLGDVFYVGYDINSRYIGAAQKKYADRKNCKFIVSDASKPELHDLVKECDVMLSLGVLHHLTDEQCEELLSMAVRAVSNKGRFVIYEPYIPISKDSIGDFFMKNDRGMNIKSLDGWHQLARKYFSSIKESLHSPVYILRYSIVVLECSNP